MFLFLAGMATARGRKSMHPSVYTACARTLAGLSGAQVFTLRSPVYAGQRLCYNGQGPPNTRSYCLQLSHRLCSTLINALSLRQPISAADFGASVEPWR